MDPLKNIQKVRLKVTVIPTVNPENSVNVTYIDKGQR